MKRRLPMRRMSFTVAVVRHNDGWKQWHTKCNRCGAWLDSVESMTKHANAHFAEQDRK